MKIGDILYFVDPKLCKVSKHKIILIIENKIDTNRDYDTIRFSNLKTSAYRVRLKLNPQHNKLYHYDSYSQMVSSVKSYLIFSRAEDAQKALVEFVLPELIKKQKIEADNIINSYNKLIEKVEQTQLQLQKETEKFKDKCNALEKKFV